MLCSYTETRTQLSSFKGQGLFNNICIKNILETVAFTNIPFTCFTESHMNTAYGKSENIKTEAVELNYNFL